MSTVKPGLLRAVFVVGILVLVLAACSQAAPQPEATTSNTAEEAKPAEEATATEAAPAEEATPAEEAAPAEESASTEVTDESQILRLGLGARIPAPDIWNPYI